MIQILRVRTAMNEQNSLLYGLYFRHAYFYNSTLLSLLRSFSVAAEDALTNIRGIEEHNQCNHQRTQTLTDKLLRLT